MGVSAKGEVILHSGRPPGKEEAVHLLSGKDGSVIHSFPAKYYANTGGYVSPDGRHVLLIRAHQAGAASTAELINADGKRIAAVKLPPGGAEVLAVSWKAGIVVTYDRDARLLTAYDLTGAMAP